MSWSADLATRISGGSIPLIAGSATLLGLIALRNGHLAERCRQTCDEALYRVRDLKCDVLESHRRWSLLDQALSFASRYWWTGRALALLSIGFIAFVASTVLLTGRPPGGGASPPCGDRSDPSRQFIGLSLAAVAALSALAAMFWTAREFWIGAHTVKMNLETLLKMANDDPKLIGGATISRKRINSWALRHWLRRIDLENIKEK